MRIRSSSGTLAIRQPRLYRPGLDAGGDPGEHQDRDDRRVLDEALGRDLAIESEGQREEGGEGEAEDIDDHEMPRPQPIGDRAPRPQAPPTSPDRRAPDLGRGAIKGVV